jgi:hypothetical protein
MLTARALDTGDVVTATPQSGAYCPLCREQVRPKCGEIVTWHFAHHARVDCDPWSEGESEWHLEWKRRFPLEWCEVVMGPHRADIVSANGWVVELQHSSISPAEIREREKFYCGIARGLVWVFDIADAVNAGRFRLRCPDTADDYRTFRWEHPRKSIATAFTSGPHLVLLDLGGGDLLKLGRLYPSAPCGGYGWLRSAERFTEWLMKPRRSEHDAATDTLLKAFPGAELHDPEAEL